MDRELERRLVLQWGETGKLLEEIRRRELRELTAERALAASDALLEIGASHPLSERRRTWSGLVEQQALLHSRRPA